MLGFFCSWSMWKIVPQAMTLLLFLDLILDKKVLLVTENTSAVSIHDAPLEAVIHLIKLPLHSIALFSQLPVCFFIMGYFSIWACLDWLYISSIDLNIMLEIRLLIISLCLNHFQVDIFPIQSLNPFLKSQCFDLIILNHLGIPSNIFSFEFVIFLL